MSRVELPMNGIRKTKSGNLLAYSILGSVSDFQMLDDPFYIPKKKQSFTELLKQYEPQNDDEPNKLDELKNR